MSDILRMLSQEHAEILLLLCVGFLAITCILAVVSMKVSKMRSRWRELLEGSRGDSLENLLYDHLRERMEMQRTLEAQDARILNLEEKMKGAKRHLGLVRYDAFEDVGGAQSFALALYDDRGDGAIVNSLIGRTDCRVYCKPLLRGRSERSLSQEEQRAIEDAVSSGPKPIVSH